MSDVGRILCETADGLPQFTVYYAVPLTLRSPSLFTEHGVYYQNHQEADRRWVYRYNHARGDRPTELELSDYRYPTDVNWDVNEGRGIRSRSETPRLVTPLVNRILCENSDGKPQFTVQYDIPSTLRSRELFTKHGVYYQNHQTAKGQWVYRYVHQLSDRPVNLDLAEYRYPDDKQWDGQQFAKPIATWPLVQVQFDALLVRHDCPDGVQELYDLAYAAFHQLPIPEHLAVIIPTIPIA